MKTMTTQQTYDWLVVFMGWYDDEDGGYRQRVSEKPKLFDPFRVYISEYHPLAPRGLSWCFDALKKWKSESHRNSWMIGETSKGSYIRTYTNYPHDEGHTTGHTSLNHAIVMALYQDVTGEQLTIED